MKSQLFVDVFCLAPCPRSDVQSWAEKRMKFHKCLGFRRRATGVLNSFPDFVKNFYNSKLQGAADINRLSRSCRTLKLTSAGLLNLSLMEMPNCNLKLSFAHFFSFKIRKSEIWKAFPIHLYTVSWSLEASLTFQQCCLFSLNSAIKCDALKWHELNVLGSSEH